MTLVFGFLTKNNSGQKCLYEAVCILDVTQITGREKPELKKPLWAGASNYFI